MEFVFTPPDQVYLPIQNNNHVFPVHRIYCVGKNYLAHAVEMGANPDKIEPCFFSKPADAICLDKEISYPLATNNLHHEVELVVALKAGGTNIPVEQALGNVLGYGVGLDLTRRDLQQQAKDKRWPWDVAKAFDNSAPCSTIHTVEDIGHPNHGRIWLNVNNEPRQHGRLEQMILSVAEIISVLSEFYLLQAGDLIFTGTPAGVDALEPGDIVQAGIDGVGELQLEMRDRALPKDFIHSSS